MAHRTKCRSFGLILVAAAALCALMVGVDVWACCYCGGDVAGGCSKCSFVFLGNCNVVEGRIQDPAAPCGEDSLSKTFQEGFDHYYIAVICTGSSKKLKLCYQKLKPEDPQPWDADGDYDLTEDSKKLLSGKIVPQTIHYDYYGGTVTMAAAAGGFVTFSEAKYTVNGIVRGTYTYQSVGRVTAGWSQGTSWTQTYDGDGRVTLTVERRNNYPIRKTYYYYTEQNGLLVRQRVTRETYDSDCSKRFETTIYAFNTVGKVTMRVDPEGVERYLVSDGSTTLAHGITGSSPEDACDLDNVTTVPNSALDDYATALYEYDVTYPYRLNYEHGSGCCGSGRGNFRYAYGSNPNYPAEPLSEDQKWNIWKTWQRILPVDGDGDATCDALWMVEFLNYYGAVVFRVEQEMAPNGEDPPVIANKWVTHYKYYSSGGGEGQISEHRHPSACTGYSPDTNDQDDNDPDYDVVASGQFRGTWVADIDGEDVDDDGTAGLVEKYEYHDPSRQVASVKVQKGTGGTACLVRDYAYDTHTYGGYSTYPVTSEKTYTADDNSSYVETTYSYAYYLDEEEEETHVVETRTETRPAVLDEQNGPEDQTQVVYHYKAVAVGGNDYNLYYNDWTKNADGTYTYVNVGTAFSNWGQVVCQIVDPDTTSEDVSDFPDGWTDRTANDGAVHLKTDYSYYNDTTGGYANYGQLKSVLAPGGQETVYAYKSQKRTNSTKETTTSVVTLTAAHMDGNDYSLAPLQIAVADLAGNPVLAATGDSDDDTDGDLTDDLDSNWWQGETTVDRLVQSFDGTLCALTANAYDVQGRLLTAKRYHAIPTSGNGSLGTNYYQSVYQYDDLGRQQYAIDVTSGTSTATSVEQVTKTVYDKAGRVAATCVGVSPAGSGGDDMGADYDNYPTLKQVRVAYYDESTPGSSASGVGDGRLTSEARFYDAAHDTDEAYAVKTAYHYDWRGRLRGIQPEAEPYTVQDVDWQGRVVATAQFSSQPTWSTVVGDGDYAATSSTNRLSLSETFYDQLGRVYRSEAWGIATNGSKDGKIVTDNFYDLRGRLVGTTTTAHGATEYVYDGAGRQTEIRVAMALKTDGSGAPHYDDDNKFLYRNPQPGKGEGDESAGTDDQVIEMTRLEYDSAGNVIKTIRYEEIHVAEGQYGTTPGVDLYDGNDFVRTFTYSWYDALSRLTATVYYGTNGEEDGWVYGNNPVPTRDSSAPTDHDANYLLTEYSYSTSGGSAGRLEVVIDPEGRGTKYFYDALGRTTYVVENADSGGGAFNPSDESGTGDASDHSKDRVTKSDYNGLSQVTKLTVLDSNGDGSSTTGDNQETSYFYLDAHNAGLVTEVKYPDGDDSDDRVKLEYALDGRLTKRTGQARTGETATVIEFDYDDLRRLQKQRVATLGSGVDDSVQAVRYDYDALGRMEKVTSYSDDASEGTGDVVNQVQRAYNALGLLDREYQAHDGAVDTSTTLSVQYGYDTSKTDGLYTKALRPTSVQPPSTVRRFDFTYGDADKVDDLLSRVKYLKDYDGQQQNSRAGYDYNGLRRLVNEFYYRVGASGFVYLTYYSGSKAYYGFDRLGRIKKQLWKTSSPAVIKDQFEYAYDHNSNRLSRDIPGDTLTDHFDEMYDYDGLDRLTSLRRGTIVDGAISTDDETRQEDWTLDQLGNWKGYQVELENSDTLVQARSHNHVNEIDDDDAHNDTDGDPISTSTGEDWANPRHDARGNMTRVPKPSDLDAYYTCTYDAWNRLVKVLDGETPVVACEFDGLNRRIVKTVGNDHYDCFYNASWQLLEVRKNDDTDPLEQYLWSLRYIDAPVIRWRDGNTDGDCSVGSDGDSIVHYLTDANMNVTTLLDATDGTVLERYAYDAYGSVTVLDADWDTDDDNKSDYDNEVLFTGQRYNPETGHYLFRLRDYWPHVGRFGQQEIDGIYHDGMNFYAAYFVPNGTDPAGTIAKIFVNTKTCTIVVHVYIAIHGKLATKEVAKEITDSIKKEWNGKTTRVGCEEKDPGSCKVEVDPVVSYYVDRKSVPSWAEKENIIEITDVEEPRSNCSWVPVPGLPRDGMWSTVQATPWAYAHECGHLMELGDDYRGLRGTPDPGHEEHMMAELYGKVVQHEIDDIMTKNKTKCPKECCCPSKKPKEQPKPKQ